MKKLLFLSIILGYFLHTIFSQTTVTFNYTGAVQTWIVPPCVYTVNVVAAGAKGGGNIGGNGARITANINVTPGQVLNIYVGGMGSCGNNSGGWNGGGTGYASNPANASYNSCGGGGATDLRIGGTALANRVIVAGGGGGKGGGSSPVCGGSANCNIGAAGCNTYGAGGGGGTLTGGGFGGAPWAGVPPGGSAGTLGNGGQGGYWSTASGGGGGGGYYGGGGGGNDGCCTGANGGGGGGGGSSLVPAGGSCLAANNANNGYLTITYSGGAAQITASNNGPICTGGTLQLSTTSQGTYAWTGPNGFTSTLQNPSIPNVTTAAAGTYTLTVNLGGCTGTATTTVVVNQSPTVTATGSTICSGQPGTVTATVSPAMAGTYTWNTGATGATLSASPNATTIYTVTFTPTGGCPGSASAAITVNPTPVLSVSNATICSGQSATLTASSTVAGGTFTWNPGGINGSTLNVTPLTTTTYTVSYSSPAGCAAVNVNGTVTVNPTPSVTVNNLTICNGQSATLTATPTVPGGTYTWNTGATSQSISVNPSTNTTYTVNYSTAAGCAAATASGTVTVNPSPVLTATNATICAGQTATLQATATTPGGTFTWNPGGISGSSLTVSPVTTTTYTLSYTSGAGCNAPNITSTVTVNPVATVSVNSPTICDGNSATLTATPSIPGGTYLWNNGATTASITVNPNTTTTYSVVYTSPAGCASPSASGTLTVNPTPVLSVNNDTICIGQTGSLSAVSTLPNGSFSWNPGGFTTPTIQVSPQQTTTYTVVFTSNLNCPSAPVSGTITVNPNPAITVSNVAICFGQTATLTATTSIPGGIFTWTPGNANGATLTVNPASTTTYTVNYSAGTGCAAVPQTATVTVNPIPTIVIPNDTICAGQTGTLTATPSVPNGTYSWTPGGQTTPAISGSPNSTTTYNLIYTSPAGCASLSTPGTIVVNPLPVITVSNATICNGQSATLTSTTSIQGGTYLWSNNATTANITVSPASTTTYTLVYTAPTGCQNAPITGTVTVNPIPTVSIVDDTICNGSTGTLVATPSFPGGTFLWTPGNQTTQNLSVSPNSTTTYTLVYTSGVNCSSLPISGTITVNPIPVLVTTLAQPNICSGDAVSIGMNSNVPGSVISWTNTESQVTGSTSGSGTSINDVITSLSTATGNVTYTIISQANNCNSLPQNVSVTVYPIPNITLLNDTICQGNQATLNAIPDVQGGTFIWSYNALTAQSITLSPNQTTSYNVLYDYNGCINTASASIVVNVVPTVTLNSGNICFGDSLTLTANPSIPGGTFNWSPGGIGPQSIMVTPNSTTSISVDYTLNNCTSQLATSNIVVTQLPVLVMDDTTICQGQVATMTALPSQPGGIFTWSPGGPGPQTAVFSPASTTSISVSYTLNGCTSNSVSRNVFVNPLPAANVISPAVSGCLPLAYSFHADTTVAHDYFTWSLNGNSYTGDSINGIFSGAGCQNITLTNTLNGCSTSTTYLDYLCPEAAPIASFDASIGYFTEPNQSVNFINSSSGAVTYNWLFGDGGSSTTESPQHNFSGIGSGGTTVWLYAYSNLGCVDSTSKVIPFQDGLIYYIPNTFTPDGDIYNNTFKPIFTSGFDPYNYSLQIFDRWGELIFESLNPAVGWDGTYGLYGNLIQIGTYSYRVRFKVLKNDEYKIVVGHVNLLK